MTAENAFEIDGVLSETVFFVEAVASHEEILEVERARWNLIKKRLVPNPPGCAELRPTSFGSYGIKSPCNEALRYTATMDL